MKTLLMTWSSNCLLFDGIKKATGEDCNEEVINLCRERLHIEITPTMIERSHRIGPKKRSMNSETKMIPIIAKSSAIETDKWYSTVKSC